MSHIVKRLPWCDVDIDTVNGKVFLQQRWNYRWLQGQGVAAWTAAEKTDFHNRADTYIWASWSNKVVLGVSGSTSFSRKFASHGVPINLDIKRVTIGEYWNVNVKKILPAAFERSNVIWNRRVINLDTNDFKVRINCQGIPKVCYKQTPVAHEFGHAAGNTVVLGRGDEYPVTSPHHNDYASMMNAGSQLKDRHFRTILDELNSMIPGTTFSIKSIK